MSPLDAEIKYANVALCDGVLGMMRVLVGLRMVMGCCVCLEGMMEMREKRSDVRMRERIIILVSIEGLEEKILKEGKKFGYR